MSPGTTSVRSIAFEVSYPISLRIRKINHSRHLIGLDFLMTPNNQPIHSLNLTGFQIHSNLVLEFSGKRLSKLIRGLIIDNLILISEDYNWLLVINASL